MVFLAVFQKSKERKIREFPCFLGSFFLSFPRILWCCVHNHHRKKIFWRTFLASKKNFPGRWWIQKPYKNQESHIHHRNLSSVDPIFFLQRKVLHWSRAVYGFFFPVGPTLIFFSLLFWKTARKTTKKTRNFFIPGEPLKSLGKKGKTLKKTRNSLERKKARNSKKQGKEDQGWRPKFAAMKWPKCCKNQCSRSQAVSAWVWTPFYVILWRCLTMDFWTPPRFLNFRGSAKWK